MVIVDDEIDRFLDSAPGDACRRPGKADAGDPDGDWQRCRSRAAASADLGIELPLDLIRQRFELTALEVDALLHCVAAELHPGYGRVFGYLNNDITRQRPSVGLILEVLCPGWAERLRGRKELGPRSGLFQWGLVTARSGGDHLAADLDADPAVLEFLLGDRAAPGESAAAPGLDDLVVSGKERAAARQVAAYLGDAARHSIKSTVIVISGAAGVGRRSCAAAICRELGWRLRPSGEGETGAGFAAGIKRWIRDARLGGEVPGLYVPSGPDDEPACLPAVTEAVAAGGGPAFVFLTADEPPRLGDGGRADVLRLHLSVPPAGPRAQVWRQALGRHGIACSAEVAAGIAATYPFTVSLIRACAREAGLRAQLDGTRDADLATLARICRGQVSHHLERLAQPVPSRHRWEDLVLPPDELSRLREIASAVRHRDRVHGGMGLRSQAVGRPGCQRHLLRAFRHREDDGGLDPGRRAGRRPVPGRPLARREQVHRGDRAQPGRPVR